MIRGEEELLRLLEERPNDTDLMIELGRAYMSSGKDGLARDMFKKARDLGNNRGRVWLIRLAERNEPVYGTVDSYSDYRETTGDRFRIR